MEIEAALRRYLLSDDTMAGYCGRKIYTYEISDDELNGSGGVAIAIRRVGGWTAPQLLNTQEYPLVNIQCWADLACRGCTPLSAQTAAWALYRALDPLIHGQGDVTWGGDSGLYVIRASRNAEPILFERRAGTPDQGGIIRNASTFVSVNYAVQTFH